MNRENGDHTRYITSGPDSASAQEVTQTIYRPNGATPLSVVLLDALEAHGADPSLFILYDYVDTESLEDLYKTTRKAPAVVEFELLDFRVTIHGDEPVIIEVEDRS